MPSTNRGVHPLKVKSSQERARRMLIAWQMKMKGTGSAFECADCGTKGKLVDERVMRTEGWTERKVKVEGLECSHQNGNASDNRIANLRWRCRDCHAKFDTALRQKLKRKLAGQ